jgi:menaquinone-specific isochorismate synthase
MNLLSWLQTTPEYPKIYWKERSSSRAFAAVGLGSPTSEAYGWRLFKPTKAPHWADFPSQFFFSPKISKEANTSEFLKWEKPAIKRLVFTPEKEEWTSLVEQTLAAIHKKKLDKLVLARECLMDLEEPVNPWPLVSALEQRAVNAYVFCIQPTKRSAFLGASPEQLFLRTNKTQLFTEALAGTRPLGEKEAFDLLHHPKDLKEFSFVEKSIRKALSPLTKSPLQFSNISIRKTSCVQHLSSQLNIDLDPSITDFTLLDRLHPTAALLGFPKRKAMELLQKLEPFERGLYGAPIGRIHGTASEWIVGIRSCLLFESTARLYSGLGIVEGSHPESEWNELNSKLKLFQGLFL